MTEIQTRSSKQSFVSSRDGLGEFLRTIAAICAISLALVAGSFHVRGIQNHIDVQEKPSGAINSGLIISKETERSQHSKYLIHKQYKRYRKPSISGQQACQANQIPSVFIFRA